MAFPVTEITCPNYEIVAVAANKRLMVTVSMQDLPAELGAQVSQARLTNNCLELSIEQNDGSTAHLRFPNVPELDVARFGSYQAALCGLAGNSVARVWSVPTPKTTEPSVSRPR